MAETDYRVVQGTGVAVELETIRQAMTERHSELEGQVILRYIVPTGATAVAHLEAKAGEAVAVDRATSEVKEVAVVNTLAQVEREALVTQSLQPPMYPTNQDMEAQVGTAPMALMAMSLSRSTAKD
jgi:hypothetical protein